MAVASVWVFSTVCFQMSSQLELVAQILLIRGSCRKWGMSARGGAAGKTEICHCCARGETGNHLGKRNWMEKYKILENYFMSHNPFVWQFFVKKTRLSHLIWHFYKISVIFSWCWPRCIIDVIPGVQPWSNNFYELITVSPHTSIFPFMMNQPN